MRTGAALWDIRNTTGVSDSRTSGGLSMWECRKSFSLPCPLMGISREASLSFMKDSNQRADKMVEARLDSALPLQTAWTPRAVP